MRMEEPATPTRAKRELLTSGQYKAARVLASIVAGGYGGTLQQRSYYRNVEAAERARLRKRLLHLASCLDLDPDSFIWARRWCVREKTEWPVWPHKMFVACIKLLDQRRREAQPDELAEQIAHDLLAAGLRHEDASRSYTPPATKHDHRECGTRDTDHLAALRRLLASLKEQGDITDSSAIFRLEKQIYDLERESTHDEWPEYIEG